MIEIVSGRDAPRVVTETVLRARRSAGTTLELPADFQPGRSWRGVRRILGRFHERLGPGQLFETLRRHRPAASLVVEALDDEMEGDELMRRMRLEARLDSHLSHNWAIQRETFDAWSRILLDLCRTGRYTLMVPALHRLDWETVAVLKSAYRRDLRHAPDLVLGYCTDLSEPVAHRHGIVWPLLPEYVFETAMGFHVLPGAEIIDLEAEDSPRRHPSEGTADDPAATPAVPPYPGDGLEPRARRVLEATRPALSEDTVALVLAALRRSFARFGFSSALHLGLDLLDKLPPAAHGGLTRPQRADLHGILALSAHNRQFRSRGNMELARFIEGHLRTALEAESRPEMRTSLHYRLAVTLGRRQKQTREAEESATRGIAESSPARLPKLQSAYQEAWCRNIRAYLRVRSKRLPQAIEDCRRGFRRLELHVASPPVDPHHAEESADESAWKRDLVASQALLAANLHILYRVSGDTGQADLWMQRARSLQAAYPEVNRYDAGSWIAHLRRGRRMDLALVHAEGGLNAARRENDGFREFLYLLQAGDLAYRLGDGSRAVRYLEESELLRRRMGDPELLTSPHLALAGACLRAGRPDEAARRFEDTLKGTGAPSDEERATIQALWALAEARRGEAVAAERLLDRSLETAVKTGERNTLLRVASTVGQVCQELGRGDEARNAYSEGREILEAKIEGPAPPAEDELSLLLGLLECDLGTTEHLGRAFELLPEALESAEAWWDVPRLLRQARARGLLDPHAPEADARPPMEVLLDSARQRVDCPPAGSPSAEATPMAGSPAKSVAGGG